MDLDSGDGEPQEELLGLDSRNFGDGAVTKLAGNLCVIENKLIDEVDVARGAELEAEVAVGGERVGNDVVGKETLGEAVVREEVVDVCVGRFLQGYKG